MPRNLTAAMIQELEKRHVRPALFAEMQFTSGILRLWTGLGSIVFNSETYTGMGSLVTISPVIESASVQASPLRISLSGIPSDILGRCLGEVRQGAPVTLRQGFLDESNQIIASPSTAWAGKMGACVIDEGAETATITLTVENNLVNLRRGPVGAQSKVILSSVMFSQVGMGSWSAANAIDGDVTSLAWDTDSGTPQSITIDLGVG